jgi:hypothetical protein
MSLKKRVRSLSKRAQRLGLVAAFATVFPAIAISFWIAIATFWWCPQGGCPLITMHDRLELLTNVLGVSILIAQFSFGLQFPFLLLARLFYDKTTVAEAFLAVRVPFLSWYYLVIQKWINLLWR